MSCDLKIWPKLGVGVTNYPLPNEVISFLKKAMADDMGALKYVLIDVKPSKNEQNSEGDIEEILTMIDNAKQYHLTAHEMQEACFRFANSKNETQITGELATRRIPKKRIQLPLLPQPKIGNKLYRKDKRRGSFSTVVGIEDQQIT